MSRANQLLLFGASFIFSGFFILFRINNIPFLIADESRFVLNILGIIESGNWLGLEYLNEAEFFNTKPPLAQWLGAISVKTFGFDAWCFRLPSAMAAMGTLSIVYYYIKKWTHKDLLAIAGMCILATCSGYNRAHITQTADADSLLIFFTSWACFILIDVFIKDHKNKYSALWSGLLFAMALLSKSSAACIPIGAIVLAIIAIKKSVKPFINLPWVIGCLAPIMILSLYYLARNQVQPGYVDALLQTDWLGRFTGVQDGHSGPIWMYVKVLITSQLFPLWIFIIPSLLSLFMMNKKVQSPLVKTMLLASLIMLLVLSLSKTKNDWYLGILFPILIPAFILIIANTLADGPFIKQKKWILPLLFMTIIGTQIFYLPLKAAPCERYENGAQAMVQAKEKGHTNFVVYKKVSHSFFWEPELCFIKIWQHTSPEMDIGLTSKPNFNGGDLVLIPNMDDLEMVQRKYLFQMEELRCGYLLNIFGEN